jgi:penicillin-binding protein 2
MFMLFLGAAFTLGLAVIAAELWRLQVVDVADFKENQRKQHTRSILIPGMRGRILDRSGRVLADSRPSRVIICRPESFPRRGGVSNIAATVDAELDRLSAVLKLPRSKGLTHARIVRHLRESSALPIYAWRDLDDEALARFAERAEEFPGFDEAVRCERIYPFGSLAAHVVGYVGHDRPEHDADAPSAHYWEPELKGRSGLEARYDAYLAGATGERHVLVDARGFKPRYDGIENDEVPVRPPANGLDLTLTIDAPLQHALERQLRGVAGAGVVMDPRTGAVLAMASSPAFNPNEFIPVLTEEKYRSLADDPLHPLLNRAIAGTYAPGSTFKPITAIAALDAGADPDAPYDCRGAFSLGALRLHCWDRYGHGELALHRAIRESCNTYFCNLGRMVGTNAIVRTAREFGLGAKTGIDLGAEAPGVVPDAEWKLAHGGAPWYPGDTCQMAIGQGMLLVTPLQMAVACSALANGGAVFTPYLRARDAGLPPPKPVRRIHAQAQDIERVRIGMRAVAEEGTGKRVLFRYGENRERFRLNTTCAAKTGTAEVGVGEAKRKNAWVIAFAPYDKPTTAVALVVERGESGGLTAGPRVHAILASRFGEETP